MFVLACEEHRRQNKEWYKQDRIDFPKSSDRERFGRRLVYLATQPVEKCNNCIVLSETKMPQ